ncbi:MAG: alpha-2-macroglobulin family protein, partial [Candidatus Competibacterales bacterium]|nr:alpha-2-macroglobulin family protein [Candidatus Competibacterales bacterium]
QPLALGIRPDFADPVSRQQPLAFDLVALDPAGEPQALADLRYTLYRENHDYYWYYRNNRWNYKLVVSDSAPLVSRRTGLDAAPTRLELAGLDSGRYRLEVRDPASGALSSLKFRVGWFVEPGGEARPDELQITLDRSSYGAGDIARVHVRAPFAGEVLLTVADHRLWLARSFTLEEGGTTFELPVDPAWSPGVYLLATAYRPGDAEGPQRRGPGRALGVTWLALDRAPRTLDIALQTPERLQPRQSMEVPVQIGGLDPGQPAYLTLAAVDEGILQLTDHADPDPLDHYFGKRRLAMEPRDLYGRLIESAELGGRLQYGAGAGGNLDARGPQTVRTVALFSGLVELDGDGHARIPLDLPDFNGELRLMAVAWDRYRYGQASRPLRVSDPLVAEVYLPRFLAPDDHARLTLELRNLDAPAGDYTARLRAEGAVSLADATPLRLRLTGTGDDSRLEQPYTLIAGQPGTGRIALELSGPDGFRVQRDWVIGVRPARPYLSERRAQRLAPGETLTLDDSLLADYLPGTASARLRFSTRPGLNVPELLARL